MNKFKLLLVTIILLQIYSCNCDKKYSCGSLSQASLSWLNQNLNDTIAFKNSYGNQIKFVVSLKSISQPYESQACKHGELGCSCDYRCEANGRFYAISDTMINSSNSYSISIDESGDNRTILSSTYTVSILDFLGRIDISNSNNNAPTIDSILPTFQLGNQTYADVHTITIDTTINYYKNKTVWKIYFTKPDGVIGFKERTSQSTFYR